MKELSISSKIVDAFLKLKLKNKVIAAIIPVGIILFWQIAGDNGLVNQSIMPVPSRIWETFMRLIENGKLQNNVIKSGQRVLQGFILGAVLGHFLGILSGLFRTVENFLIGLIGLLRPIPAIATIPIFILAFGIGETSKIAIIAIGTFWPILLNSMQGIKSADRKLLEVATTFEKSKIQILFHIILPSALPSIFTGIRLGVSAAWTHVVTAEMIAASSGIGYLITYARELFQPAMLFVGVATIGVIGLLIDVIVLALQKSILYWNVSGNE